MLWLRELLAEALWWIAGRIQRVSDVVGDVALGVSAAGCRVAFGPPPPIPCPSCGATEEGGCDGFCEEQVYPRPLQFPPR